MRTAIFSLIIGLGFVAACSAEPIQADPSSSTEGLGEFLGQITYTPHTVGTGQLVIVLENTSDPSNGGFITGFALNNPGGRVTGSTLTDFPTSFPQLGLGDNSINAQPFGDFDLGAALGGSFQGGGSPHAGIGVGEMSTFEFALSGDLYELTEQHFLAELSEPRGKSGSAPFVVRFRGFNNGGSDKVPGGPGIVAPPLGNPLQTVPEPSSIAIWSLLGLIAAGLVSRKR